MGILQPEQKMTTYLFSLIGVWCFYHAWRGINPTGSESGQTNAQSDAHNLLGRRSTLRDYGCEHVFL
jgi:hypothetical protein